MNKYRFRNVLSILLATLMVFASMSFNVLAGEQGIAPRVAVQISMQTDANASNEVDAGDIITATVSWKSVGSMTGEPITISTTGGAEILINQVSDVVFKANGVQQPITGLRKENGAVKFTSGPTAMSPLDNQITYQIKAPSVSGSFTLSTKVAADAALANPVTNYVEKTFSIVPSFSVGTSTNTVSDDATFDVFGEIGFENTSGYDYMVALEVRNKNTGAVVQELGNADFPTVDGSYSFAGCSIPSTYPGGAYIVEVTLLDLLNGYVVLATEQTEIVFSKTPVVVNPDKIVITDLIGVDTMNATYNVGGTRPRYSKNANATIKGYATMNSMPASNAEVYVGILNNSTNSYNEVKVTTDDTGAFTASFKCPNANGAYNQWVTVSTHYFDLGTAYAQSVSDENVVAVKPIYIFSTSL